MKPVFAIEHGIKVPDGTVVYPFLNPKDSTSGLPRDLIEGFSIAAGDIEPHSESKIQVLPLSTQVTFVIRGTLNVCIKDAELPVPETLLVRTEQAIVTRPGTFFQLINPTDTLCRVLYIVSPPYIFDKQDDQILYDDAVVFDEDWQALAKLNWQPAALLTDRITARQAALDRLANPGLS
jgi:mannose-6-phosphate isomerase-like protein (cupin superfamily)